MKKGLFAILVIVSMIAVVSVGILIYVVKNFYFNQEEPATVTEEANSEEVPEVDNTESIDDGYEDEPEVEPETETGQENEESGEPEESEEPEESSIAHSRIWEYLSKNSGDNAFAEMSEEECEQEWEKADALLDNSEYRIYFVASHLPDDWCLETCDVIRYVNGSKQYWYNVENTDVFFGLTFESDTAQGVPGECWNMYGDAPAIMFNNGVPANAEEIYNSLVMQGIPSASYVTDYVEGDSTITLSNAWSGIVEYEDLKL